MAEPKKRMTSTRSGNRQSKDALSAQSLINCSNCKQKVRPHQICKNCGFYKGEKVVKLKDEREKNKKIESEIKENE